MPPKASAINSSPDALYNDDDSAAFVDGSVAIKLKGLSLDAPLLGKVGVSMKGACKDALTGPHMAFAATPSIKFGIDLGDVKIAVDKMDFKKDAIVTETSWNLAADKNFSAGLNFTSGKGAAAEALEKVKFAYKMADVTIDGSVEPKDAWSTPKFGLGLGLTPAPDVNVGLKFAGVGADAAKLTVDGMAEYSTKSLLVGLGFSKVSLTAPAQPPISVKMSYSDIPDLKIGAKVDLSAAMDVAPKVGCSYTGLAGTVVNVAVTPLSKELLLNAKYSMGKSSATLGCKTTDALTPTFGLSLEIA